MSTNPENQTILITGACGFVATHIVNLSLQAGYSVRGTVRSNATAEKLSFAIVEDMGKIGAFDVAVQGVHGVIHTATPFKLFFENNERDLLRPAIDGTCNVLDSVSKHAPQVKRVVINSSFAAMMDITKGNWPDHVYSAADWNPMPYEVDAASDAYRAVSYSTAKALAERAAWDFVQEVKPQFDIATIMPPMIYGPNLNATADLANLNTFSADIYRLISLQSKSSDLVPEYVLELRGFPKAGGERFFICNPETFTDQQVCDILRAELLEGKDRVPTGTPGSGKVISELFTTDVSKSQKVLGLKYRNLEETVVDAVKSLLALEAN
ncbi:NAD-dependent epimerase/dehydratase [Penicillium expansum]|nr:NAD-dependent epimerase/dehydratase [Penicillium expansum]